VKLVLQRAFGDCAVAAIATLTEQTYEDVYVEAAKVEPKRRGRSGVHLHTIIRIGKKMGILLLQKREPNLDEDEGLLVVEWAKGSRHEIGTAHLIAVSHGVVADPADGIILPPDEYLAREKATAGAFLELR
jgi:hypothetical protein